jgi:WD40 repeat protein
MPCHDDATRTSGLSLESYAALMRGGKGGAVVVPGHSGESRLVGMIEGRLSPRMPPAGPALGATEIAAIKAWIDAGASGATEPSGRGPASTAPEPAQLPALRPSVPVHGAIDAVAFSPDGRLLALGGYRRVWLLDVSTGSSEGTRSPARSLPSHSSPIGSRLASLGPASGPVTSLAFSPDGRLLAAGGGAAGQFGEIHLWDVARRRLARTLRGHRDAVYSVAFSPDGRTLAAASYDRLVSLWPLTGGQPRMLKDHIDAVYAVAFSPNGRQVASASGDRTIKVWDAASGLRVYTLSEPAAEQYTVAFSRDGKQLAAGGADKILRLWNVRSTGGKLARSAFAHEGAILRVVFSPDGRRLFTTGEDRRVKVWDTATLTERRVLERQPDWAPALALSPDARRLAVGRFDGSVALYDTATGNRLPQPGGLPGSAPTASGSQPRFTGRRVAASDRR